MLKKLRTIQMVVVTILIESIQLKGLLKYSNWFDLYWRISQTIRILLTVKKRTRRNSLIALDLSIISDDDISVYPKSIINKMLFMDMKKE